MNYLSINELSIYEGYLVKVRHINVHSDIYTTKLEITCLQHKIYFYQFLIFQITIESIDAG